MPSLQDPVADTAEGRRRWLRRSCWTGCLLALGTVLFLFGQPLYVRSKLERHGWEVGARGFGFTGLQAWRRQYLSRWIDPIEDVWLEDKPVLPRDLELMRYFPNLKYLNLKTTAINEQAAIRISQLSRLEKLRLWDVAIDDSSMSATDELPFAAGAGLREYVDE